MNFAAYLATPATPLYERKPTNRVLPKDSKDCVTDYARLRVRHENALKYRAVTNELFTSTDVAVAVGLKIDNASRVCRRMVEYGYARKVKTIKGATKAYILYEWLPKNEWPVVLPDQR